MSKQAFCNFVIGLLVSSTMLCLMISDVTDAIMSPRSSFLIEAVGKSVRTHKTMGGTMWLFVKIGSLILLMLIILKYTDAAGKRPLVLEKIKTSFTERFPLPDSSPRCSLRSSMATPIIYGDPDRLWRPRLLNCYKSVLL
jgi:hypothetical protein